MDSLLYPVIYLDLISFTNITCAWILHHRYQCSKVHQLKVVQWDVTVEAKAKQFGTVGIGATSDHDIADECSIPCCNQPITFDIPPCSDVMISNVLQEYKHLSRSTPCATTLPYSHINTENPVRVPHVKSLSVTSKKLNAKSMKCDNREL